MDSLKTSILVTADARGVAAGLAPALVAFNQFESVAVRALTRAGTVLDRFGAKRFAGFAIGAAGAGLLGAALVGTLGPAIRFEDAFAGVLKTVDGTPEQLNKIRGELIDMSKEMPLAATELAGIAEAAGQLGVQASRVTEFTRVTAELAATTDLGFDGAARNLARFLNVVDGGVQNVDAVSNVLVDLGNNFATTESQILTFATRLGPAFSAAGASSEEILSIATAFSSLGIQAELGGSALNRVITEMADSARLGDDRLRIFADTAGILPDVFRDIVRENPVEAFRLFVSGLGDMQAAGNSISPTLEALGLNGIRITQVLTTAANQTDTLTAALARGDTALAENSARQVEYAKRAETTASRIEILKNRLTALAITAGTPLLDGLVAVIDRIGDEVVRLTDALGPLGAAIFSTLSGVAGGFVQINNAFGDGGALGRAGDLLIGLATTATIALEAVNSLGPVGPILLGLVLALTKIPGAAGAAGLALGRLKLAAGTAEFASNGLRYSLGQLATGLARLGTVAGVLALVELGNAISEAKTQAAEAADVFRNDFNEAIKSGEYSEVRDRVSEIREEIARLEELDKVPEGLGGGFDGLKNSLVSTFQILTPFTENTMLNARARAEALRAELDELTGSTVGMAGAFGTTERGISLFDARLNAAGAQLGLTSDQVLNLADTMGLLEAITVGSVVEYQEAINKLETFGFRADLAGNSFQSLRAKVLDGDAAIEEIAEGLGISVEALYALDRASDDVDLDKMFDGEPEDRLQALDTAAAVLVSQYEGLATAVGTTSGEFILQQEAVRGLADSLGALESAMQRARDVQEQLKFQQDLLVGATEAHSEALAGLRNGLGTGELEAYANAVLDLTLAEAANASSVEEGLAIQARLKQSFIENALAAGASREEVLKFATEVLGIPPSAIIDIVTTGLDVTDKVARINEQVELLDREVLIRMGIIDSATGKIAIAQDAIDVFAGRRYEAFLDVNDVPATQKAKLVEQFLSGAFERNFLATVDADTAQALADLAGVKAEALTIDDIKAIVGVDADTELAEDDILALALLINTEINKDFVAGLTAEDRGVLAEIAGVEPSLLNFADIVAVADLDADGDPAEGEIFSVIQFLAEYGDIVEEALLEADGKPAAEVIAQLMEDLGFYDAQEPEATLGVDPSQPDSELDRMNERFNIYGAKEPVANPQVDNKQPDSELDRMLRRFDEFAAQKPTPKPGLDPTRPDNELDRLLQRFSDYASRRPTPKIDANTSSADSKLNTTTAILNALRDKTIYVTTVTRNVNAGSRAFARGGIIRSYADGGVNLIPAAAGTAQIYAPAPPGSVRIHSEPVTGGEAYIPLGAHIRERSLAIWRETGRLLGAAELANGAVVGRRQVQSFQDGGIRQAGSVASISSRPSTQPSFSTSFNINPQVVLNFSGGPPVSTRDVAQVVRQEVGMVMKQAAREFQNVNPH